MRIKERGDYRRLRIDDQGAARLLDAAQEGSEGLPQDSVRLAGRRAAGVRAPVDRTGGAGHG